MISFRKEMLNYNTFSAKWQALLHMKPLNLALMGLFWAFLLSILSNRHHIFFKISPTIYGNHTDLAYISLYISDILLVFLGFLGLYRLFTAKILSKFPTIYAYGAYFALILSLLILIPRETNLSWFFLLKYLEFGLLLAGIASIAEFISAESLLWYFTLAGAFESVIAIFQFYSQKSLGISLLGESRLSLTQGIAKIDLGSQKFIRAYGTFAHPNILSAFLVVACATAFTLSLKHKGQRSYFSAALLILLSLGNIVTFSRAGIAAEALVCLLILILAMANRRLTLKSLIPPAAAIFAVIMICLIALKPFLLSRATISDSSTISRINYDRTGIEIFKKHWLFGVGPGNILIEVAKTGEYKETWQVQPPHNYFLLVACETGIFGLLMFLYFIYVLARGLYARIGERTGMSAPLLAILAAIIFLMMFDHYFYDIEQGQLLLWSLIAIIIVQIRAYNLVAE